MLHMDFAMRFNGKRFAIDTTGFQTRKLEDMYKENISNKYKVYNFNHFFFYNSNYGVTVGLVDSEERVIIYLPKHLLSVFQKIDSEPEAVEMVEAGLVGFQIYTYTRDGKEFYSIRFVNKEE